VPGENAQILGVAAQPRRKVIELVQPRQRVWIRFVRLHAF
jgi:hypothetical protein